MVELTLKNWLARGKCQRAYKHMVKFILNPCELLGSYQVDFFGSSRGLRQRDPLNPILFLIIMEGL